MPIRNEARMRVMSAPRRQVDQRMEELLAQRRPLRQHEITAELFELWTAILVGGEQSEEGV